MEILSNIDQSIIFNSLTKDQKMQYVSASSVGNFVYNLVNNNTIYHRLSYEGQRKLLRSMDENKRVPFIIGLTSPPLVLKYLSLDKITNLFREIQRRVHIDRPNSVTFKDTSIVFNLPDYRSSVTIHETPNNYVVKETTLLIRVRVLLQPIIMADGFVQTITRDRFPRDSIQIMETINDLYSYIGSLDQVFFMTYSQLKTQIIVHYN
jgi:hypothetical protein